MNHSSPYKIAGLSIGDELIYGEILDSNFTHIASSLYDRSLPVERHMTVGDGEASIVTALRELAVAGEEGVGEMSG
jgi:nicotinamide-nucleotide amidase